MNEFICINIVKTQIHVLVFLFVKNHTSHIGGVNLLKKQALNMTLSVINCISRNILVLK